MHSIQTVLTRFLLTAAVGLQLVACSRTVEWEEEVPVNTGETIVVKRTGTYSFKPEPGNGLNLRYAPDWKQTIVFSYGGKTFRHTGEVNVILLAIGPDGVPNLIGSPGSDWGWKNNYYCVTPYYVQFRPNSSGSEWSWPERIDTWLYGLPTNLMFGLAPRERNGERFTENSRDAANASLTNTFKHLRTIDPTHAIDTCPRRS